MTPTPSRSRVPTPSSLPPRYGCVYVPGLLCASLTCLNQRLQLALDLGRMQRAIAANRVSPRVILLYSFCRQMRTLYLMGNFPQLLQRSVSFIGSFLRQLRELHETTGVIEWYQPFQWAVGACLEIAYASELSWSGHDYQVSSASVPTQATQAITPEAMSRHLGDVLYLARRVLRAFASASNAAGYSSPSPSPSGTPTTTSPQTGVSEEEDSSTPWYEWLRQVFESRELGERYQRCVWEMSHLASLHFSRSSSVVSALVTTSATASLRARRGSSVLTRDSAKKTSGGFSLVTASSTFVALSWRSAAPDRQLLRALACYKLLKRKEQSLEGTIWTSS